MALIDIDPIAYAHYFNAQVRRYNRERTRLRALAPGLEGLARQAEAAYTQTVERAARSFASILKPSYRSNFIRRVQNNCGTCQITAELGSAPAFASASDIPADYTGYYQIRYPARYRQGQIIQKGGTRYYERTLVPAASRAEYQRRIAEASRQAGQARLAALAAYTNNQNALGNLRILG